MQRRIDGYIKNKIKQKAAVGVKNTLDASLSMRFKIKTITK